MQKMQKMQKLAMLLLLLLLASGCSASPSPSLVRSALDLISREVPEGVSHVSSNSWRSRLARTITALQSNPTFDRLLRRDAEAAVVAAASSARSPTPTFNCQLTPSTSTPTSVHRLRPGDVKVVGAMGDSLTAANGAKATSVLGLLIEYRGFAWSIGGQTHIGDHTTLPNILRHSNPNLVGHSTGNGAAGSANAKMNVAEPGKVASDMPNQAIRLVDKLKADPKVDFQKDWKVITMFVGGNDVCDYCKDKSKFSPSNYIKHIREALDYLHANVPRAFVNVAEVLDVALVRELKQTSFTCGALLGGMLCRCAANPQNDAEFEEIRQLISDYQRELRSLVDSGRYDTREDFTVVNQPFYRNSQPPRINGKFDVSFFAPDCFHFSAKGHNQAAMALWNNMLQPVGGKSTSWDQETSFLCPTSRRPYLMTAKNS